MKKEVRYGSVTHKQKTSASSHRKVAADFYIGILNSIAGILVEFEKFIGKLIPFQMPFGLIIANSDWDIGKGNGAISGRWSIFSNHE